MTWFIKRHSVLYTQNTELTILEISTKSLNLSLVKEDLSLRWAHISFGGLSDSVSDVICVNESHSCCILFSFTV